MLAIAGVGLLAVGVMVLLNAGAEPPGRLATVGLRALCVGVAVLHDGTVTERWSTLLDPRPGDRVQVGGLTLAGQPLFADIEPRLTKLLRGGVLVAHSAPFDVSFLAGEYQRAIRAMPKTQVICTLRLAHRLELNVASLSLVDCCAYFGSHTSAELLIEGRLAPRGRSRSRTRWRATVANGMPSGRPPTLVWSRNTGRPMS
jgi:Exonuclease